MKKNIIIEKEELLDEFLAIFSIGLTYCMDKDLISSVRALQWLFSPSIALSEENLKNNNVSIDLTNALEYASELDACYGADYYKKCIGIAQSKFVEVVKNIVSKNDLDNAKLRELFLDIFQ